MDIKNIIIGIVALVGAVFGGLAYFSHSSVTPPFGALTGPVIPYNFLTVGGATVYDAGVPIRQATSTLCAIQSPPATSTVQAAQIRLDVASSTATIVEIGVSTSLDATTTLLGGTYHIAGGAQAFIVGSTTPTNGAVTVLAPNSWVNFNIGGGILGAATGLVPVGTCQAEFIASN